MKTTDKIWHLLTRKITKHINREENEELQQLLEKEPSLQEAYKIVDHSRVSLDNQVVERSMNHTWEKIAAGMKKENEKHRIFKIRRYAAAACIALIVAGGFIVNMLFEKPEMLLAINEGTQAQLVILPDSSEVWLGSGAKLEYPKKLASHKREVLLEGEAFFDVKKDNGRQFKVITNLVQITVLGTRFDVKANERTQIAEIILESGSVKLTEKGNPSEEVILKPGEMGTVSKQKGIDVCNVDVYLYTAWKDEYLNLESLMLGDIMFMLSQRYHTPIKIEGENLRKEIFSGRFDKDQSLEEILNTISLLIPLEYQKQADGSYFITHKPI